jgi:hypothetical protein
VGALLAASVAVGAGPARAALEEFEHWSVAARELDDENGLDDMLRSFSPWANWRWRAVDQGARVGMGCATTETWEVDLDVKLRHWLSPRVMAEFRSFQQEEIGEQVSWNEFSGSYAAAGGLWLGAAYRPSFEKESHDAALFGGLWRDRERWLRLRLGFEDALNDFWDERTQYIEDKERRVYEQQPYELEASGEWHAPNLGWLAGRLVRLFPFERGVTPAPSDSASPASQLDLSGWLAYADWMTGSETTLSGGVVTRWKSADRADSFQTTSGDSSWSDTAELRDFYLRPWLARSLGRGWTARLLLQGRWSSELHFDGTRDHTLETRHLGGIGGVVWSVAPFLDLEGGLGLEDVRVEQDAAGDYEAFTHGSRFESRFLLGLDFHWNGGRIVLIETLEGDNEGYQTVGFHDKGFVQIAIEF